MAKKIIHLNEDNLKSIIRETLTEISMSEFQRIDSTIPTLRHTDKAFLPGDILCRVTQRNITDDEGNTIKGWNGRTQQQRVASFNYIKEVNGDKLLLDNGDVVPTQSQSIRTTDTWYTVFKSRGHVDSTGLTFDYQNEGGQVWVVVDDKSVRGAHHTVTRYKYEDVKNCPAGEKLKGESINADPALENSGFWIAPNSVVIKKSMNPMPGTLPIPKSFICLRNMGGMASAARMFDAWDITSADQIVSYFPWLADMPAFWAMPKEKGGLKYTIPSTKQKCTPSTFKS